MRTVYRDVTALAEAGIPVVAEAGVGYSLVKGYFLPPVAFTEEEAQAMLIGAVLMTKFGGADGSAAARSARLKVQSILPGDARERMARLVRQTIVLSKLPAPGAQLLPVCARAVAARHAVQLRYAAAGHGETDRVVEPLGTVLHDHFWYLIAWCRLRRDFRSFRLDRASSVTLLADHFETRPGFDLEKFLRAAFEVEGVEQVRLWFSDQVLERAVRELGLCVKSRRKQTGGAELTVLVWGYEWLSRWLLPFGGQARVVAPDELRDTLRARVAELSRIYPPKVC